MYMKINLKSKLIGVVWLLILADYLLLHMTYKTQENFKDIFSEKSVLYAVKYGSYLQSYNCLQNWCLIGII